MCNLVPEQRRAYLEYLASRDVQSAVSEQGTLFKALTTLRKICNHPDLLQLVGEPGKPKRRPAGFADFGAVERSGKLQVLEQVLAMWHTQGHRALIFTQTR